MFLDKSKSGSFKYIYFIIFSFSILTNLCYEERISSLFPFSCLFFMDLRLCLSCRPYTVLLLYSFPLRIVCFVMQDSPVFNFINSLSPIKPVKSANIAQTFNSLSFASLPSIFTSPHVSSLKESRFLKR